MKVRINPMNTVSGDVDTTSYDAKKPRVVSHEETFLYKQTKPILNNLMAFGLFIPMKTLSVVSIECPGLLYSNIKIETDSTTKKPSSVPLMIYAVGVNMLAWLNVIRLMFLFQHDNTFGPILFGKVTFIGWSLFCAITCSCLMRISLNSDCLHRFFLQLEHLCYTFETTDRTGLTRKSAAKFTAIGWSLMILNITYCSFGLHATSIWENAMYPFSLTSPYYKQMTVVYIVIHFYMSSAWGLSAVLTFIICKIMYHQIEAFNDAVKDVTCGRKSLADNIQRLRSWHQQICYIVDTADNMLCAKLGAGFVLYIMISCVVLYNLFWDDKVSESIISLITGITWLCLSIAHMALFAIGGGVVNAAVSRARRRIHIVYHIVIAHYRKI